MDGFDNRVALNFLLISRCIFDGNPRRASRAALLSARRSAARCLPLIWAFPRRLRSVCCSAGDGLGDGAENGMVRSVLVRTRHRPNV